MSEHCYRSRFVKVCSTTARHPALLGNRLPGYTLISNFFVRTKVCMVGRLPWPMHVSTTWQVSSLMVEVQAGRLQVLVTHQKLFEAILSSTLSALIQSRSKLAGCRIFWSCTVGVIAVFCCKRIVYRFFKYTERCWEIIGEQKFSIWWPYKIIKKIRTQNRHLKE